MVLWQKKEKPDIEVWGKIREAPGYEVSTLGRVRNIYFKNRYGFFKRRKPHILRACPTNKFGHLHLTVCTKNGSKSRTPHSLVMDTFVGKRPFKYIINHKNGIPYDNRLVNLEYITYGQNLEYSYRNGFTKNKLYPFQVKQIRALRKNGEGVQSIAKKFGICHQMVCQIARGQTWKHIK